MMNIKSILERFASSKLFAVYDRYKSAIVKMGIAISLLIFALWKVYYPLKNGTFDYTLISYMLLTIILVFYVLIRKHHKVIDKDYKHQFIASAAYLSGILFIWQPLTGGETEIIISNIIIFTSNILGVLTLINLGKSFGILIAMREIKTNGLYSFVRHPMYGSDILLRIGFMVSHFSPLTIFLMVISILCYFYRAVLEERYLSNQEEYRQYMKKVRYRFIPYVL